MGNVTFLGVEGSGKSALMSALVNFCKEHQHEGWFLRPETQSAFSFVEHIPSNLSFENLPHQTTELRYLAWSVVKDETPLRQMDMLNYPDEIYRLAFLDAEDDLDPETFKERLAANKEEVDELLQHLLNSEQVFVLFNLSDAIDLAQNEKNLDAVWVTNACLDYLHRLPHNPRITLLLTQIDRYTEEAEKIHPRDYLQQNLPLIANNFPTLDVLAIDVLGDARRRPHGLEEVLKSILSTYLAPKQEELNLLLKTMRASVKDPFDPREKIIDLTLNHIKTIEYFLLECSSFVQIDLYETFHFSEKNLLILKQFFTDIKTQKQEDLLGFIERFRLDNLTAGESFTNTIIGLFEASTKKYIAREKYIARKKYIAKEKKEKEEKNVRRRIFVFILLILIWPIYIICKDLLCPFEYSKYNRGIIIEGWDGWGDPREVHIPKEIDGRPVVGIGDGAFADCSRLTSVTIPNSVTEIGNLAFADCSRLTSVTIPNSVKTIAFGAFSDCSRLTSVTIPESVTEIGFGAFSGCSGLISVTIPNGVTEIRSMAFANCTSLTFVTIPNSVTEIEETAFGGCSKLRIERLPRHLN